MDLFNGKSDEVYTTDLCDTSVVSIPTASLYQQLRNSVLGDLIAQRERVLSLDREEYGIGLQGEARRSRRLRDLSAEYEAEDLTHRRSKSVGNLRGKYTHAHNYSVKMVNIKPDRYIPGEGSIEDWLEDFERKAKANNWTDVQKLGCLPCYLSGAPLK